MQLFFVLLRSHQKNVFNVWSDLFFIFVDKGLLHMRRTNLLVLVLLVHPIPLKEGIHNLILGEESVLFSKGKFPTNPSIADDGLILPSLSEGRISVEVADET